MILRALPPVGLPITTGDILAGLASVRRGAAALEDFREEIRRCFAVRHVVLASSGRAALSILLQGLHSLAPDRRIVALPAFTSFSVPSAVVNAGLRVALYDLDPDTLSPVPESLARVVNRRTLAVVVCHLYGYLADLDVVREITTPCGVTLIDDAAQAMGALFRGKPAGTCGDAGIYSLGRGKNINAVAGGIIVTDREELTGALARIAPADKREGIAGLLLKALLLSALMRPSFYWFPRSMPALNIGASIYNPDFPLAPLTPFQAGIAGRMLARLPEITRARRNLARLYRECLGGCAGISPPRPVTATDPVYLRFPLLMDGEAPLQEAPELGIVRSYPEPLNRIEALYPHLVNGEELFPGARRLADRLLTLPTHRFVTRRDRESIAAIFSTE